MKAILLWFEGLPLSATTAIVAGLSAVLALTYVPIRSSGVKWWLALLSPFGIAACVYRVPVWMGADPSEYSSWALLFITIWGGVGAIASALAIVACGAIRRSARE